MCEREMMRGNDDGADADASAGIHEGVVATAERDANHDGDDPRRMEAADEANPRNIAMLDVLA